MLLKKKMLTVEIVTLQGERLISVPPASFPGGASDEPLNPIGVTLSTILQSVFTS